MSAEQKYQKETRDIDDAQEIGVNEGTDSCTVGQEAEDCKSTPQSKNEEHAPLKKELTSTVQEQHDEQLESVSSQKILTTGADEPEKETAPPDYEVVKDFLEVNVDAGHGTSSLSQVFPEQEEMKSGVNASGVTSSSTSLKTGQTTDVTETYHVITKGEIQHIDDWESVNKSCLSEIPPIDPGCLHELERRARDVAGNLDHLLGTLSTSLKSMSVLSLRTVDAYESCTEHVGETVDASVKSMYTLIAKCERLDASMAPLYRMAGQIKDIKKTLDILESACK